MTLTATATQTLFSVNADSFTTSSSSPTNGALYGVFGYGRIGSGSRTPTLSGTNGWNATWTRVAACRAVYTDQGSIDFFWGIASSGTAGTVTLDFGAGTDYDSGTIHISEIGGGPDLASPIGFTGSGKDDVGSNDVSCTMTGTPAATSIVIACSSSDAGSASGLTAGSGYALYGTAQVPDIGTSALEYDDTSASATVAMHWGVADHMGISAVEIVVASAAWDPETNADETIRVVTGAGGDVAITYQQGASNGAANAGPVTVTFDSTPAAGDLILLFHVDADTTDNAMPAVSGYTDVGTSEQYANGSSNDCNSKAWYKYSVGTETDVVCPDTGGGTNDGVSAVVLIFRGVASAADGGPFSTAIQKTTGTGSGHADPPQIATATDDVVVIMGGAAHATTGVTFTAPANYTTNAEPGTAGTDTISSGAGMAYRASGYANPENPGAFTASATAAGDSWNAVTLALKVAPAAAPRIETYVVMAPHRAP